MLTPQKNLGPADASIPDVSARDETVTSQSYLRRSTNIAMPMPPATHIDSMP
jgi:hypothetical protein